MGAFKHNKKRDTGLVYEFLVRKLSKTLVEKDQNGYRRAMEIVHKYYGDGTPLAEERELFDVIRNTRSVTESTARRILGEVQRHALMLDSKRIDIKKSNLIKEINHSFGKEMFTQHRVPEYRLLASIQMVIDATRTQNRLTESVQKIQLEEGLVKYMMTRGSFSESITQKSEIDSLVMAMVAKRFNEKYSKSLSTSQKRLLEKYIRAQVSGDMKQLKETILQECQATFKSIDKAALMTDVKADSVMSERLQEARKKLESIVADASTNTNTDDVVENMMMFQKLVEEVESDE